MSKKQQGFTLIELMIVIAIIGILAAIAIPQYQDYVTRSKVTEGFNLSETAKTAVGTYVQTTASFPTSNKQAGLPQPSSISGQYVGSITIGAGGIITIKYASAPADLPTDVATKTVILTPKTTAGSVAWSCNGHTVTLGDGSTFTGTAGTVPSKYLPSNCR
ncbi:MAG TPA: pilin [Gammaproteobacteria bacterium]|nr:pilin [Gammaproteobacteria bacterium]